VDLLAGHVFTNPAVEQPRLHQVQEVARQVLIQRPMLLIVNHQVRTNSNVRRILGHKHLTR
jgi:hypothetical protein